VLKNLAGITHNSKRIQGALDRQAREQLQDGYDSSKNEVDLWKKVQWTQYVRSRFYPLLDRGNRGSRTAVLWVVQDDDPLPREESSVGSHQGRPETPSLFSSTSEIHSQNLDGEVYRADQISYERGVGSRAGPTWVADANNHLPATGWNGELGLSFKSTSGAPD
jgi:hypothetical protein